MDQAPKKYALVFINWRTPELTTTAVRSAQEKARDLGELRIIIVDNGSADGSVDTMRELLPEAEIVELPENRGFAGAVNAGLQRVEEPYAFVLNSDTEFRNDAVSLLAEALAADEKAVLATPKLLRPDGSIQAAAVPEPGLLWELTNRSLARHLLRVSETETSVVPSIVGPCMAVDMEKIRSIGFLDERFFFFFEETDWCKRIRAAGLHVLHVPAAEVMHLQGESANRRPTRARVQFYLARYQYFRKHTGRCGVAALFIGMWLRLTVEVILHALLVLLTAGRRRHRDKLAVYATLWLWHLLLCRPHWGFEKGGNT